MAKRGYARERGYNDLVDPQVALDAARILETAARRLRRFVKFEPPIGVQDRDLAEARAGIAAAQLRLRGGRP